MLKGWNIFAPSRSEWGGIFFAHTPLHSATRCAIIPLEQFLRITRNNHVSDPTLKGLGLGVKETLSLR